MATQLATVSQARHGESAVTISMSIEKADGFVVNTDLHVLSVVVYY
jgi:hypothetical protein